MRQWGILCGSRPSAIHNICAPHQCGQSQSSRSPWFGMQTGNTSREDTTSVWHYAMDEHYAMNDIIWRALQRPNNPRLEPVGLWKDRMDQHLFHERWENTLLGDVTNVNTWAESYVQLTFITFEGAAELVATLVTHIIFRPSSIAQLHLHCSRIAESNQLDWTQVYCWIGPPCVCYFWWPAWVILSFPTHFRLHSLLQCSGF